VIIPETHRCDAVGCEEQHGKTNGWWALIKDHEGVVQRLPILGRRAPRTTTHGRGLLRRRPRAPALSALMGGEA